MPSPRKIIQGFFPNLQITDYKLTSPETDNYNCIAWAAGVDHQFWWPTNGYHWPAGVAREESVAAFIAAFGTVGYVMCADGTPKVGFEKLALYTDAGSKPTHAARLLPDGKWTSKLGPYKDISHRTLFGIEGAHYGKVTLYMERPIP